MYLFRYGYSMPTCYPLYPLYLFRYWVHATQWVRLFFRSGRQIVPGVLDYICTPTLPTQYLHTKAGAPGGYHSSGILARGNGPAAATPLTGILAQGCPGQAHDACPSCPAWPKQQVLKTSTPENSSLNLKTYTTLSSLNWRLDRRPCGVQVGFRLGSG